MTREECHYRLYYVRFPGAHFWFIFSLHLRFAEHHHPRPISLFFFFVFTSWAFDMSYDEGDKNKENGTFQIVIISILFFAVSCVYTFFASPRPPSLAHTAISVPPFPSFSNVYTLNRPLESIDCGFLPYNTYALICACTRTCGGGKGGWEWEGEGGIRNATKFMKIVLQWWMATCIRLGKLAKLVRAYRNY